ncbi:MAG: branched-chain amino acid aminotransferase [Bacteroidales bacterium]|jgi:branched-chain amino acid aminotransferase|nr:branched-chain amino acid aminotransferase [Bacteroidales bacterium]
MDSCLHSYFVRNEELRSTCDFNGDETSLTGFVYEVVRVIDGVPLFLDDHINRLKASAEAAAIKLPVSEKFINQSFKALIINNKVSEGNIKCVLGNRSANRVYYAAWFQPHAYPAAEMYSNGVIIGLLDEGRYNPKAKVWRAEFQERILKQKKDQQVFEVLLIPDGALTEGTKTNVFLIKNNEVFTAPSDQVLQGITRTKVVELAKDNNILLFEKNLVLADLLEADAVFLTGTSPKILPVKSILDHPKLYQVDHPVLQRFIKLYDKLIQQYIARHK